MEETSSLLFKSRRTINVLFFFRCYNSPLLDSIPQSRDRDAPPSFGCDARAR